MSARKDKHFFIIANILFIFRVISRKYRIFRINDSEIILHLPLKTKDI